ncbi:MAG: OadG family protein [Cellulosilyticaceae bacterium]
MIFTKQYDFQACFESFLGGFSVFLIGVSMVFFALVLLIALIKIVSIIVDKTQGTKTKKVATQPVTPVVAEPVAPVAAVSDDLELVAVITAAIAASLGTTTDALRVRSLRQVNRQTRS